MKRVFRYQKGSVWDGCESIIHFLDRYLLEWKKCLPNVRYPEPRKNWKVTVIVEEEK